MGAQTEVAMLARVKARPFSDIVYDLIPFRLASNYAAAAAVAAADSALSMAPSNANGTDMLINMSRLWLARARAPASVASLTFGPPCVGA